MQNEKALVGYFFECLACKATFIRIVPEDRIVDKSGKIFSKNPAGRPKPAGFVRCPDCLSQDVRLAEIGDRK